MLSVCQWRRSKRLLWTVRRLVVAGYSDLLLEKAQRLLRTGFAFAAASPFFATRWFFGVERPLFVVEAIRNALSLLSLVLSTC